MTTILKPVVQVNPNKHYISFNMSNANLFRIQHGKCFYCNVPLNVITDINNTRRKNNDATIDHIFPAYHGFSIAGNKVYACAKCNGKKGHKYPSVDILYKFVKLYSHHITRKNSKLLVIKTKNNKPVMKLVITPELISQYCR